MRIVLRVLIGLGVVVVLLLAVLYGGSQAIIRSRHTHPLVAFSSTNDAATVAEGARLAKIAGCRGCHSPNGEGSVWDDPPWFVATIAPPGLARKIAGYSDPELERLIHHGLRKDGTSVYVMPTVAHRNLADEDVARIIAWLHTLKPGPKDVTRATTFGPMGRMMILFGQFPQSYQVGDVAPKQRPADIGRYYYDAVCSECHALDKEQPAPDGHGTAPALAPMAASYSPEAFHRLLRTGQGMSNRDLGLMKEVAIENFTAFTDDEIDRIHAYLKGEAAKLAK